MSKSTKRRESGSPQHIAHKKAEKLARERRRSRARTVRWVAVAALVVVAGGGALYAFNQRESSVRDLSAVGSGVPAVVQVHDVTCPVCSELRRSVERIENEFGEDELLIRVADVATDEGLTFAARHTPNRRVTLLFLDGDGELVDIQTGAQSVDALRRSFRLHADGDL